jgi:hypothetical protein
MSQPAAASIATTVNGACNLPATIDEENQRGTVPHRAPVKKVD